MEQIEAGKDTSRVPPGTVVVTVAALWKSIEESFKWTDPTVPRGEERPWSIATDALPQLPDPDDPNPDPGGAGSRLSTWFCAFFRICPTKK
ncbi:MAG: hypothetical protein R2722_05775 [Tessaracoccus sp.]